MVHLASRPRFCLMAETLRKVFSSSGSTPVKFHNLETLIIACGRVVTQQLMRKESAHLRTLGAKIALLIHGLQVPAAAAIAGVLAIYDQHCPQITCCLDLLVICRDHLRQQCAPRLIHPISRRKLRSVSFDTGSLSTHTRQEQTLRPPHDAMGTLTMQAGSSLEDRCC